MTQSDPEGEWRFAIGRTYENGLPRVEIHVHIDPADDEDIAAATRYQQDFLDRLARQTDQPNP